jgi:DNA methylase
MEKENLNIDDPVEKSNIHQNRSKNPIGRDKGETHCQIEFPSKYAPLLRKGYPLTSEKRAQLAALLQEMENAPRDPAAANQALEEVHNSDLYLALAGNFESFCEEILKLPFGKRFPLNTIETPSSLLVHGGEQVQVTCGNPDTFPDDRSALDDHEIAAIFPLLSEQELHELALDIASNGLHEAIWLYEGKILDGRNRYRACQRIGVKPFTRQYEGSSPASFVISLNNKRRHLSSSQKAAAAAEMLPWLEVEAKKRQREHAGTAPGKKGITSGTNAGSETGEARQQAAKAFEVSPRYVSEAKAIKEISPEDFELIKRGVRTVSETQKRLRAKQQADAQNQASEEISTRARIELQSVVTLHNCSIRELFDKGIKPDAVITTPPCTQEAIPMYAELAKCCRGIPSVAVVCEQTYLPEIMAEMCQHLEYRWLMSLLMEKGQIIECSEKRVNTGWKPVLLFGSAIDWVDDVCKDKVSKQDELVRSFGPSVGSLQVLVERLTKPGQLICDPFLGDGITAVVSVTKGRKFVGCDIESLCFQATREKLDRLLDGLGMRKLRE